MAVKVLSVGTSVNEAVPFTVLELEDIVCVTPFRVTLKDLLDVAWNGRIRKNLTVDGTLSVSGKTLINLIYPVGAVYISVNSTSPATLFGGTWERIAQGRTLIGLGSVQANTTTTFGSVSAGVYTLSTAQSMGGAYTHTHNTSELYAQIGLWTSEKRVSHTKFAADFTANRYATLSSTATDASVSMSRGTAIGGSLGSAHTFPPYFTVYIWKRTA